jgi:hypothetical protein
VVTHAHSLCGPVTQRRRHMARIDGEAVEPRVLRVDADGVPVHCRFGGRVRGVGDGEVVAVACVVSLTHSKMTDISSTRRRKSDSHQQSRRRPHRQKYRLPCRLRLLQQPPCRLIQRHHAIYIRLHVVPNICDLDLRDAGVNVPDPRVRNHNVEMVDAILLLQLGNGIVRVLLDAGVELHDYETTVGAFGQLL